MLLNGQHRTISNQHDAAIKTTILNEKVNNCLQSYKLRWKRARLCRFEVRVIKLIENRCADEEGKSVITTQQKWHRR